MSAYIRSKITNSEDDIVIQLGATTTIRANFSDDIELDGKKIVGLAEPEINSGAATKSYVDTSIANLVDGAPLVLDTLNELAAAIGDNANFVTDINASIAGKLPLAGGTLTGELILDDNPVVAMGAATKQYVDNLVNGQMIYSTSDIPEGSGLYYTNARARGAISAGTGISYDSNTGVITNTLTQYTDTLARNAIGAGGSLSYDSETGIISYTTPAGFSGNYNDLINRPTIPSLVGYATESYVTSQGYITSIALTGLATETYVTTRGYLTSVDYSIITDKPTLVTSYTQLTDKPTIPTNINSLSDVDTITRAPVVGEALVWGGENWIPGASITAVLADASLDGGSFD